MVTKTTASSNGEETMVDTVVEVEPVNKSIIEIEGDLDLKGHAQELIEQSQTLYSVAFLGQMAVVTVCLIVAFILAQSWRRKFRAYIDSLDFKTTRKLGQNLIDGLPRIVLPALVSVLFYLATKVVQFYDWPSNVLSISTSLAFAWLLVSYVSSFIQSRVIAKWVATLVLIMMTLRIVGWWDPVITLLDSVRFGLGDSKLSLLAMMKGTMYFIFFLWLATIVSSALEKQIKSLEELTPSLKVLFSKLMRIALIFFAFMFGLNAIGFDLTSFAIFGGAIGVGLGFGLQKVVSNFISGIILLLDRSIKPGDVIAVGENGDTFGWVNTLGARYVSIIRRDGKEHLIPNELLITEKVENWSFSNNDIRLHIPVGISYHSDVRKALDLCLEAAQEDSRIKKFPEPVVRVRNFGENSVDLEIRGWINDPVNGIGNIRSDVLLVVWDKFREHNIEIPYPQRDLHIKSLPSELIESLKAELKEELKAEILTAVASKS